MAEDEWAPATTGGQPVEVPGYTDLREVARGGDSIVYRARQLSIDRDVAIKVVQITDPGARERFERELAITVRLGRQHPHIVTVLDTTTTAADEPCLVMEFHDLGSLHDRLRAHGPLPVSDVVTAGTAVADALAFAHAHGVLHRDVKPQNVLVLPTSYVLSDFGIARMSDAGHTATLERFSYRHASPQVLDGLAPTVADDVWSLGSTLFTLLDGRAPFAAPDPADDTALGYLRRVRTDARRPLVRDDVPDDLRALVEACLVPDRDTRLATAEEALARLRSIRTESRSWDPSAATGAVLPAAASAPGHGEPNRATEPSPTDGAAPAADPEPVSDHGQADGLTPGGHPTPAAASTPAAPAPSTPADPDALWAPAPGPTPPSAATADPDASRDPSSAAPAPTAPPSASSVPTRPASAPPAAARAVAPSVLAHVTAAPAHPVEEDEHTGLLPASPPDGAAAPGASAEDDGAPTGGAPVWRRIAAFLSAALLVGAAVGVAAVLLDDRGEPVPTAQTPTTVPSATAPVTSDDPPNITVVDPALSPRQLAVDADRGSSVDLSWTAPQQEVSLYVVVRVDGDDVRVLTSAVPPLTSTTVEGLAPEEKVCFAVVGLPPASMPDADPGLSDEVCRR